MRKSTTRAGLVAALLCTFACGGSRTPLQPDEPIQALTGTWAGPVTESPGERDGTLRLMLWQVDAGLWGTFALEFPDASFNRAGRVDGLDLAFRTVSITQMRRRVERAGFRVQAVLGDYDGAAWDPRADVWLIIAERR